MWRMILCCCWPAVLQAQDPMSVPFSSTLSWTCEAEPNLLFGPATAPLSFRTPALALAGQRLYGLPSLARYRMAALAPLGEGRVSGLGSFSGDGAFQRFTLAAGYARRLGELAAGIRFHYLHWKAGAYGAASTLSAEIGLLLQATPDLHVGFNLLHPVALRWGKSEERLARVVSAGMGWNLSAQVTTGFTIQKTEGDRADLECLVQYRPLDRVAVRLGVNTATSGLAIGASLHWNAWRLVLDLAWHPRLGNSPSLILGYQKQDL